MKEGWEEKRLGDVLMTGAGGTPLKSKKEYYENGTIPWLMSGEVGQPEIHKSKNRITKLGLENSSARIFPTNTVLVAMYGATVGQVGILKIEACTNQAVCGILPSKNILPKFIYYYFVYNRDYLISKSVGNAQPNFSQIKIKDLIFPIPPLPEQKEIVAKLDEAFAAIDLAKANIEKNIENARELFQSRLNEIFSRKGEGWEEKRLGDVCEKTSNIKWQADSADYQYIDLSSVSRDLLSVTETSTINSANAPSRAKKLVKTDDVIFATTRPTLRRVTLIDKDLDEQICSTGFAVLRAKNGKILPNYIFYFLQTDYFIDYMETLQRGTSYPAVTDSDVKSTVIIFPQIPEQKEIIAQLDVLNMYCKESEEKYNQKLINLEELKKSLLQKAFAGELT